MEGRIMETILDLMVRDHQKINEILKCINGCDSFEPKCRDLNKLRWSLEKHIFTEEKAILTKYEPTDDEGQRMLAHIVDDHEKILRLLKSMEVELKEKQNVDISEMMELLDKHESLEEDILYPRLEGELPQEVKQEIIERIANVDI
jgi:hemerythrin-like domain-containing protein